MSRVLVTGGAGYIGSHTCKRLAREGHLPVVFDNLSAGHRAFVRYGPFVQGDLADTDLLLTALRDHRADAVIHFAASAYVGESMQNPQRYFRNNVGGTINLLDAMHASGVKHIVFSSTCATYGMPVKIPITERDPQKPVNPYGESKLFVEKILHWNAVATGLGYVALRYFNAAGADLEGELGEIHDPETHAIPLAIQAAQGSRSDFELYGTDYPTPDGTAIRDYIHVDDLAGAHVAALRYLQEGGESDAFNLGTGTGHSVREVIRAIEATGSRPVPVKEVARRPGDPAELVADAAKAGAVLGWRAEHSDLKTIVESAWRWALSYPNAGERAGRVEPSAPADPTDPAD